MLLAKNIYDSDSELIWSVPQFLGEATFKSWVGLGGGNFLCS